MTKRWVSTALFVVCLVIGQASASAGSPTPMQTVKERIDQIISVLNDPQYHAPARKEAQRDKIWEISKTMFDFTEISRRTVGPKWDGFSDPEKSRFTDVFMQFLGNTYIDKMQGEYHNEQVVYLQEIVKEPQALVRTQLKRENVAVPIDYRMKHVRKYMENLRHPGGKRREHRPELPGAISIHTAERKPGAVDCAAGREVEGTAVPTGTINGNAPEEIYGLGNEPENLAGPGSHSYRHHRTHRLRRLTCQGDGRSARHSAGRSHGAGRGPGPKHRRPCPPPISPHCPRPNQAQAPLTKEEEMLLEDDTDWSLQPDEEIYTVADPLEIVQSRDLLHQRQALFLGPETGGPRL